MTDKEVIKALECHAEESLDTCSLCPLLNIEGCAYEAAEYALDLINRQQAEIEKHKNNCEKCGAKTRECIESLHNIIAEQQAEIKELNTIRSRLIYDSGTLTKISDELYQKIKAEAVKEFAEKLKFVWFDNRYDSPDIDFDYFVDILVETLAGDTE